MSTRFTPKGTLMVESHTLQLTQESGKLTDLIARYLSKKLVERGYESITPSLLSFLSVMDCGVNYGSEIARSLGVSRQMVAKTVKELCGLGYLEQVGGIGKQKNILFTQQGEHLISDARQLLSEIDELLREELSDKKISDTIKNLSAITSFVNDKLDD